MWKDYSWSYIKHNRASSVSIMAAALIAAMFLSLLCSLAYNFWIYEIEKITLEEGSWQGRIAGRIDREDLSVIQKFANVEKAVVSRESPAGENTVVDIYFGNVRTIYQDMPLISAQLGLGEDSIQYHSLLLSRYLIHDPEDPEPPMLLTLYLAILIIVIISLILIIRNSFELSMNARIHQFGILSSIGASPKQIRVCLLQETAVLTFLPIIFGTLSGILISCSLLGAVNLFAADVSGRQEAVFHSHPAVWAAAVFSAVLTVLFSAWIPAGKLSRMTPLEAVRGAGTLQLKKKRHSRILFRIFGMEGELAGNALRAQKKSMRISSFSLFLSFLGFTVMLVFTTLASISTRYTYFERYQDAWDIMITLKDTEISDFHLTEELRKTAGVRDVTVYQKAEAVTALPEELQSDQLAALGGLEMLAGIPKEAGRFPVEVPVVVLDDAGFLNYCSQIGIEPSLGGAVALNRIWDSENSNFRYKKYVSFVKEESRTITLSHISRDNDAASVPYGSAEKSGESNRTAEIPILSYTRTAPLLREEYKNYALVHFVPLTLWNEVFGQIKAAGADSYIRIFSRGDGDLADLSRLEKEVVRIVSQEYELESENRVRERLSNDRLIDGMEVILGGFCVLLAVIGIANVFFNTLGFLRQRKREFAQYMSVGLTPEGMWKILCIEAFVTAGKPLLTTLLCGALFVQYVVGASCLDPMVFWAEAPVVPVFLFAAAIVLFVGLAYYIGGKRLSIGNLLP